MNWQYSSISRGGTSIIEQLKAAGVDYRNHLQFCSLRAYDEIKPAKQNVVADISAANDASSALPPGPKPNIVPDYVPPKPPGVPDRVIHPEAESNEPKFVTELLYIHSKLMIVDDRVVICGSGFPPPRFSPARRMTIGGVFSAPFPQQISTTAR